jgi:hypothetical protein
MKEKLYARIMKTNEERLKKLFTLWYEAVKS